MNRRRFLSRLGAAFAAALAAPTLLELLPAPAAPPLAFRSDAFGISMRLIEKFEVTHVGELHRYDVLFGMSTMYPSIACPVGDYQAPAPGGFARYLDADRAIQESLKPPFDGWSRETLKVGDIITFESRPA